MFWSYSPSPNKKRPDIEQVVFSWRNRKWKVKVKVNKRPQEMNKNMKYLAWILLFFVVWRDDPSWAQSLLLKFVYNPLWGTSNWEKKNEKKNGKKERNEMKWNVKVERKILEDYSLGEFSQETLANQVFQVFQGFFGWVWLDQCVTRHFLEDR